MNTVFFLFITLISHVVSFRSLSYCPTRKASKLKSSIQGNIAQPVHTLLIDNFDSYTYNVWQLLAEVNGVAPHVIYNNACGGEWENILKSVPDFDNIVLSPGPGSPDKAADFGLCLDAILKSKVPLLGVCLGHQGMAHAYGGKVSRAPVPMHGRLSAIQHSNTGIFAGVTQGTEVVRYHSLVANAPLPEVLRSTAWTAEGIIMGMEHKTKPQFGVQFHPESIKTESGRRIFTNFRDITLKYKRSSAEEKMQDVNEKVFSFATSSNISRHISTTINTHTPPQSTADNKPATQRSVHTTSFTLPLGASVSTEEVFQHLYGSHAAAFWLDSECPGPVQVLRTHSSTCGTIGDNSTESVNTKSRLSYMGAVDGPGGYALEYTDDRRLIKRTHSANSEDNVSIIPQSIFEYLREQLRVEKEAVITHTHSTHRLDSALVTEGATESADTADTSPALSMHSALFGYLGYEVGYESAQLLAAQGSIDALFNSTDANNNVFGFHNHTASDDTNNRAGHPAALLLHPSQYVVYDHSARTYHVVDLNATLTATPPQQLAHRLEIFLKAAIEKQTKQQASSANSSVPHETTPPFNNAPTPTLTAWKSRAAYKSDIANALDSITAGETYEVCLTMQFQGPLLSHGDDVPSNSSSDPIDGIHTRTPAVDLTAHGLRTYRTLRRLNRAPYACYLRYDPAVAFTAPSPVLESVEQKPEEEKEQGGEKGVQVLPKSVPLADWYTAGGLAVCSTSPECFLRASQDGTLISRPIKGTSRRDLADPTADQHIARTLAADEKSQAENLMIVDLVRNDLGRVCEVGSVQVPGLMEIESYATVHQMVSTVNGTLRKGCDVVDALVATYPGGSMTGAPKLRTMQIIRALEQRPRGVYSGSMGYIGLNGAVDLNIVIRTALLTKNRVKIGAGGAIVAMSNPDEEVDEVELKAQSVAKALGYQVAFPAE